MKTVPQPAQSQRNLLRCSILILVAESFSGATQEYATAIKDSALAIQEQYANEVEALFQETEERFTSGRSLESVRAQWDWTKKMQEDSYDSIKAGYEIAALEGKFNKAINSTKNLQMQKDLTKLKEQELKALREQDRLTESDVKRAEKKLEIMVAEQALLDA